MKANVVRYQLVVWVMAALISADGFAAGSAAVPSRNRFRPSFEPLVAAAGPSVVNIGVMKNGKRTRYNDKFPMMREFLYDLLEDRFPQGHLLRAMGTGFIIDPEGYILTTNHMVEGATRIMVQLSNEREYLATIVGQDPQTDTALIKISAQGRLPPLQFGDSDALSVGDWVVAIGNPLGFGNTVTCGIVSAKYRDIGIGIGDSFIQTDASINPGNNGGPLLNMDGEVVGINSILADPSEEDSGISFSIPINQVKRLLPQLRQGKVKRSWLGIKIQDITPGLQQAFHLDRNTGALISQVIPGSPASQSGLRRGDVVVAFDSHAVRKVRELTRYTVATAIGKTTSIDVIRQGARIRREITTEERVENSNLATSPETESLFGLTLQTLTADFARDFGLTRHTGVLVTEVDEASPAFEAGLEPADIIIEADQLNTPNLQTFLEIIANHRPHQVLLLLVDREGSTIYFTLALQ